MRPLLPQTPTKGSLMGYFANGTEGMIFEEAWCSRCAHSDTSGNREIGVHPPCPVWMAHTLYAYQLCNAEDHPAKIILDMLIPTEIRKANDGHGYRHNECALFHPHDAGAAIPGQLTITTETPLA